MRSLTPSENTSTNPEPRSELRRGRGGGACSKGTLYSYVRDEMSWGLRVRGTRTAAASAAVDGVPVELAVTTDATVMYGLRGIGYSSRPEW